ncbi:hypothetical protein ES703_72410 [subsurface metagenome]
MAAIKPVSRQPAEHRVLRIVFGLLRDSPDGVLLGSATGKRKPNVTESNVLYLCLRQPGNRAAGRIGAGRFDIAYLNVAHYTYE